MKKSNLHSLVIGFFLLASFCCCIFLNTVTVAPADKADAESSMVSEQEAEETNSDIIMPDIDLVKKVFSKTKALLPPL